MLPNDSARAVLLWIKVGVALVAAAVFGFGIYAIWFFGYSLHFSVLMLLVAAIWAGVLWWCQRCKVADGYGADLEDDWVKPSDNWGHRDREVWEQCKVLVAQLAQSGELDGLESFKKHAIHVFNIVAEEYHNSANRSELKVTLPEVLLMGEMLCNRYRTILQTHVPLVENVEIKPFYWLYRNKDVVADVAPWLCRLYKATKILTPQKLIIDEIKSLLLSKVFCEISNDLQKKLKKALLMEVVYTSIDLYSGRCKVKLSELESSNCMRHDQQHLLEIDPLRVCLIGQVSAGKSSVVNSLIKNIKAEVGILPTTADWNVHICTIDELEAVHLVDTQGLDGNKKTEQLLIEQVVNSDLVLWVLKANQSARELDVNFRTAVDDYYRQHKNLSIKRPLLLGVLNQVDRLEPASEWNPPYKIDAPDCPKAQIIKDALDYNEKLLSLDAIVPVVAGGENRGFNVEKLEATISICYEDSVQVQLNRRRIESINQPNFCGQTSRIVNTARKLFTLYQRDKDYYNNSV